MPTEQEYKYVLKPSIKAIKWDKVALLQQGYLCSTKNATVRVRSSQEVGCTPKWCMTVKYITGRVIEIEKRLNLRDGHELWDECRNKLKKLRCIKKVRGLKWEVDFFLGEWNDCHFVMAEVEVPEGSERPKRLPTFVQESLACEVAYGDNRFSSKRLSDSDYAWRTYQDVAGANALDMPECIENLRPYLKGVLTH